MDTLLYRGVSHVRVVVTFSVTSTGRSIESSRGVAFWARLLVTAGRDCAAEMGKGERTNWAFRPMDLRSEHVVVCKLHCAVALVTRLWASVAWQRAGFEPLRRIAWTVRSNTQ